MPPQDPRDRHVVIDANALYAMPLADTLLTAATADNRLFQLRWSADLLQEVRETMERHGLSATAVERRIGAMAQSFLDEEVRGYQELIPHLQLPDPDDRHVLAAAIHAQAEVIVTDNLKDFPPAVLAPHGLCAQSPSEFLTELATQFPEQMLTIVREQADRLQHPAITFDQLLRVIEQYAPDFSRILRDLEIRDREIGAPPSEPVTLPDESV